MKKFELDLLLAVKDEYRDKTICFSEVGILTNMKLVGYFENVQIWKTVDELIKEYQNTAK